MTSASGAADGNHDGGGGAGSGGDLGRTAAELDLPDLRLVVPALAAWVGAACGALVPASVAVAAAVPLLLMAAVGTTTPRRARRRRGSRTATGRRRVLAVGAVCLAGGLLAAGARSHARQRGPLGELAEDRTRVTAELVLTGDPAPLIGRVVGPRRVDGTMLVRARVERLRSGSRAWRLRHPVVVFASGGDWSARLPGDRVRVRGTLSPPQSSRDAAAVLSVRAPPKLIRRTGWAGRLAGRLRAGLHESAEGLPDKTAGLLPGLVDGDTSRLDPALRSDFKRTGMTHLVAVSGSNVAVVLAAALLLARRLGLGPRAGAVAAGLLLVGFVVLARPSPSVLRAAGMGAIALVATVTGRERRAIPALAGTVLVLVLVDPGLARSLGFALSTCATAGLLLLAPGWRAALARRLPGWLADAVAVPLAAQAACTPLIAAIAGEISLVAVPANVLAMPAVGLATIGGVIAAVTAPVAPPVARLAARLAGVPTGWLARVAERGADVPMATLPWPDGAAGLLAAAFALAGLAAGLRRLVPRRLIGAALATALVVAAAVAVVSPGWPPRGWSLVACDVGQGDALVVRDGRAVVVVDTGPDPEAVDDCLRSLGVRRVAAVVLTHLHADHVEGLPGVLRGRRVGVAQLGPLDEPADEAARVAGWLAAARVPVEPALLGERRTVGGISYTVLGPERAFRGTESDPNNSSVVLLVQLPGLSVLLTGDVEQPAQQALLARRPDLRVDVLKVPHHGSARQVAALSAATGASVAITSVGKDNPYGHPAAVTLQQVAADGMRSYRTDDDGDIAVRRAGGDVEVVARRGRGAPPDRPPPLAWTLSRGTGAPPLWCPVRPADEVAADVRVSARGPPGSNTSPPAGDTQPSAARQPMTSSTSTATGRVLSTTSRGTDHGSYSAARRSTSAHVGSGMCGSGRLRASSRRRCSFRSRQRTSTTCTAASATAAALHQVCRAAAESLTESTITGCPSARLCAASAPATW
ncbi:MAG TPA: ComEC/Rec2 family competence protein [Mycobacteriales bacterium]|nr:ComEC/Rec2 family competence protein [Mycobacteriales bacterium]